MPHLFFVPWSYRVAIVPPKRAILRVLGWLQTNQERPRNPLGVQGIRLKCYILFSVSAVTLMNIMPPRLGFSCPNPQLYIINTRGVQSVQSGQSN